MEQWRAYEDKKRVACDAVALNRMWFYENEFGPKANAPGYVNPYNQIMGNKSIKMIIDDAIYLARFLTMGLQECKRRDTHLKGCNGKGTKSAALFRGINQQIIGKTKLHDCGKHHNIEPPLVLKNHKKSQQSRCKNKYQVGE